MSLARGISEDDPLVVELLKLCRDWPLSSVGARGVGEVDASAILAEPCLRRLYADRVVERGDASRLQDPRVAEAVREGVGGFPALAPALASR